VTWLSLMSLCRDVVELDVSASRRGWAWCLCVVTWLSLMSLPRDVVELDVSASWRGWASCLCLMTSLSLMSLPRDVLEVDVSVSWRGWAWCLGVVTWLPVTVRVVVILWWTVCACSSSLSDICDYTRFSYCNDVHYSSAFLSYKRIFLM